jgi:hypothetical protein
MLQKLQETFFHGQFYCCRHRVPLSFGQSMAATSEPMCVTPYYSSEPRASLADDWWGWTGLTREAGQSEVELRLLQEAGGLVERTGEHWCEVERHWLRGEVLWRSAAAPPAAKASRRCVCTYLRILRK